MRRDAEAELGGEGEGEVVEREVRCRR